MAKKVRNTVAECKECGATADEVFLERIKGSDEYICDDCAAELGMDSDYDDEDDEKYDDDEDDDRISEPDEPDFIDEDDAKFYTDPAAFDDDFGGGADDSDFY